jgi:uncharacterized phage protein gp47/JayE
MPFTRNSLQEIIDRIVSDFQTRITGATSLLRRSFLYIIARVNAGAFHLLYEYLDYQARQLFISTADEAGLESHGAEYGLGREAAVAATGNVTATGTNGIVISAGTQLSSADDQVYTVDSEVTIAGGTATLAVTASVAGVDGNQLAGSLLTFVSPIAGVDTTATVMSGGLSGGKDEETDSAYRARLLARKRQPPHGGADFDYVTWALEYPGVTRAWSFPQYQGTGTIGIAFVMDNEASIIPDASQRAAVRAYIVEHEDPASGKIVGCPVTAEPGLFMIGLTNLSIDFEINVYPNTSAVRTAIGAALLEVVTREGGPGETIYLSEINDAINTALGVERHKLVSPIADITASTEQLHRRGTMVFNDY